MSKSNQSFHLVDFSPWPLYSSALSGCLVVGFLGFFHLSSYFFFFFFFFLFLVFYSWMRDVSREGFFQGVHSYYVIFGLSLGMFLFIVSEIFFFFSFFWSYFHSSLVVSFSLGGVWPPVGVFSFNVYQTPLLNTIVLLSSGAIVTFSHFSLLIGDFFYYFFSLFFTFFFGFFFLVLQFYEYYEGSFSFSDSVYGSLFYLVTGFHGFHVLLGSFFLLFVFFKGLVGGLSVFHHLGFEMSVWYWHFVDVVWLFLFSVFYWWSV
uniref:Cytochrome c oxidase subunit 3 n=1 Tax=Sinentomon erythranum TaxID=289455 RepID=G3D5N3_9HEXA|nr:cytochrome c oxidase subunit III [Sinentomon erythranum]ADN32960.1 cytochrome c oxidase subunit III [Sinentomon erythranum]